MLEIRGARNGDMLGVPHGGTHGGNCVRGSGFGKLNSGGDVARTHGGGGGYKLVACGIDICRGFLCRVVWKGGLIQFGS